MYVTVATINIVHGSWQHHLGHLHSCKYNLSVAPQPHGRVLLLARSRGPLAAPLARRAAHSKGRDSRRHVVRRVQ